MHIAQFVHRYPPALGGAEAYTARLCNYLADCGDTVRVWTSDALDLEEMWQRPNSESQARCVEKLSPARRRIEVARYRPLCFPARRYVLKTLSLLPVRAWQCATLPCNPICLKMWRDAEAYDGPLDAVHALAFPYSFPILCGLKLARRRGVPFFITPFLHLGDPNDPNDRTRRQYTRPHLQWLLLQADGVFVQTRLERDAAIDMGVPPEDVFLQGLGVDPRECTGGNREAMRARLGVSADEVVVGHLANNSFEKGTCDLLQAAERLWAEGVEFRLVLAGPEMPNFRAAWERFRGKDRIVRLGILSDAHKRDFFAGIDAFALPSRTDSFGLVLLEAWANRKPNLVYRAGGPAELVRDEVDGLHADCGDIAKLSSQLKRFAMSQSLREELGSNGLARVAREFPWQGKLELVRSTLVASTSIKLQTRDSGRRNHYLSDRLTARAG